MKNNEFMSKNMTIMIVSVPIYALLSLYHAIEGCRVCLLSQNSLAAAKITLPTQCIEKYNDILPVNIRCYRYMSSKGLQLSEISLKVPILRL